MVLHFLFRTPRRDLGPRDSPPADSLPHTSQVVTNKRPPDLGAKLATAPKFQTLADAPSSRFFQRAGAMALRPPALLGGISRDSPPADSPAPNSQGGSGKACCCCCGSGNGARAKVARKTKEVEHMLANLEKEGVKIDGKIASIIDDEVARIKAEAARPKRDWISVLECIVGIGLGFALGAEYCESAIQRAIPAAVIQKILFSLIA